MTRAKKKSSARPARPPTRHLTFLLLRKEVTAPEEALKPQESLRKKQLPDDAGFEGVLYIHESAAREPRWVAFLKEGLPGSIQLSPSTAPGAVLFIKVGTRLFAVTFGQGRHMLKPDSFEIDFGLKTTLNTVDAKKLRSLDSRTFEELTVHTRRQLSRSAPLDAFSVDVYRDLLGAVTGEPSDGSLAKRFTGRDALAFTGAIAFRELAAKCKALYSAYQGKQYKEKFSWVDNIRLVRSRQEVQQLDDRLLRKINAQELEKIYLAPPELIPWDEVAGFLYPRERRGAEPHPDLDLRECLAVLAAQQDVALEDLELSLDDIKRHRIRAVFEDSSFELEKWSLYNCLVAELDDDEDSLHVISSGQWFRVEKTFAAKTLREASGLVKEFPILPAARSGEDEGSYNTRAAHGSHVLALLDRELFKSEGAHTPIEACDLFSSKRQFIHVKRKVKSAALSHLFSQGVVAAETFLRDEGFRTKLRDALAHDHPALARLLGDPAQRPEPAKFEIVFAVITEATRKNWPRALPFFSQLNLVRNAQRLRMLGFDVSLCRIGEES